MKKKFGVLCLVLFAISFTSAYTHDASNVYLFLNGQNTNFQIAINSGNFSSSYVGGTYSSQIIFGHNASEIIVNVNGTVKSFQNAINDGTLNGTLAGRSPANYVGYNMIHGEYGTNITIINRSGFQKSLQNAINDGEFYVNLCIPKTCSSLGYVCGQWDDGCGETLSCGSCPSIYNGVVKYTGTCDSGGKSCSIAGYGCYCDTLVYKKRVSLSDWSGYYCGCPAGWVSPSLPISMSCISSSGQYYLDWVTVCVK